MEINEKEMLHDIHIDISMYNAAGDLVPSAYQRMVINMIEEHLDSIEMGEKAFMEKHGLSWILLYMALEIKRRISPSMKLTARTWHSQTIPPYFRRDAPAAITCSKLQQISCLAIACAGEVGGKEIY